VAGKLIILKLKPGEHHEYLIFINQLYDMTLPGKYEVTAAREIPKEMGKGRAISNTIAITVTE
jgi:hypothetical protein